MPIHGDKILVAKTPGGVNKIMRNTVCPCTGPLTSVAKLCDAENLVAFSNYGSFIMDLKTGAIVWMTRTKDDCYELELEVVPYSEAKALLNSAGWSEGQGFQRRP